WRSIRGDSECREHMICPLPRANEMSALAVVRGTAIVNQGGDDGLRRGRRGAGHGTPLARRRGTARISRTGATCRKVSMAWSTVRDGGEPSRSILRIGLTVLQISVTEPPQSLAVCCARFPARKRGRLPGRW